MKQVYFAGPVSINPEQAIEYKQDFLETYYDELIDNEINVASPHMMYGWLNDLDSYDGKGGRIETYALDSCLDFLEKTELDALVMLTAREEESSGMRAERDLAEDLEIPIYNYSYFTTEDGTLQTGEENTGDFSEILSEITEA